MCGWPNHHRNSLPRSTKISKDKCLSRPMLWVNSPSWRSWPMKRQHPKTSQRSRDQATLDWPPKSMIRFFPLSACHLLYINVSISPFNQIKHCILVNLYSSLPTMLIAWNAVDFGFGLHCWFWSNRILCMDKQGVRQCVHQLISWAEGKSVKDSCYNSMFAIRKLEEYGIYSNGSLCSKELHQFKLPSMKFCTEEFLCIELTWQDIELLNVIWALWLC